MFKVLPPEIISEILSFLDFSKLKQLLPLHPTLLHSNVLVIYFIQSVEIDSQPVKYLLKRHTPRGRRFDLLKTLHLGKSHVFELTKLKTFFVNNFDTSSQVYMKKMKQFHHHRICILQSLFCAQQMDEYLYKDPMKFVQSLICRWNWLEKYGLTRVTKKQIKRQAREYTHQWLCQPRFSAKRELHHFPLQALCQYAPVFLRIVKYYASWLPLVVDNYGQVKCPPKHFDEREKKAIGYSNYEQVVLAVMKHWKVLKPIRDVIQFLLIYDSSFRYPLARFISAVNMKQIPVQIENEGDWKIFVNFFNVLREGEILPDLSNFIKLLSKQNYFNGNEDIIRQQLLAATQTGEE